MTLEAPDDIILPRDYSAFPKLDRIHAELTISTNQTLS